MCTRWLKLCNQTKKSVLNVNKFTNICTNHFVNKTGPCEMYPDPLPSAKALEIRTTMDNRDDFGPFEMKLVKEELIIKEEPEDDQESTSLVFSSDADPENTEIEMGPSMCNIEDLHSKVSEHVATSEVNHSKLQIKDHTAQQSSSTSNFTPAKYQSFAIIKFCQVDVPRVSVPSAPAHIAIRTPPAVYVPPAPRVYVPPPSRVGKQGLIMHSQAREIVANVIKFMKNEADTYRQRNHPIIPLANFKERIITATGISANMYTAILKQSKAVESGTSTSFSSPSKKRQKKKK